MGAGLGSFAGSMAQGDDFKDAALGGMLSYGLGSLMNSAGAEALEPTFGGAGGVPAYPLGAEATAEQIARQQALTGVWSDQGVNTAVDTMGWGDQANLISRGKDAAGDWGSFAGNVLSRDPLGAAAAGIGAFGGGADALLSEGPQSEIPTDILDKYPKRAPKTTVTPRAMTPPPPNYAPGVDDEWDYFRGYAVGGIVQPPQGYRPGVDPQWNYGFGATQAAAPVATPGLTPTLPKPVTRTDLHTGGGAESYLDAKQPFENYNKDFGGYVFNPEGGTYRSKEAYKTGVYKPSKTQMTGFDKLAAKAAKTNILGNIIGTVAKTLAPRSNSGGMGWNLNALGNPTVTTGTVTAGGGMGAGYTPPPIAPLSLIPVNEGGGGTGGMGGSGATGSYASNQSGAPSVAQAEEASRHGRGLAEGGPVAPQQPNPIVSNAVAAIKGEHPEPQKAVAAFVQAYGQEAFARLREQVVAAESADQRGMAGIGGMINGPGTGTSDSIPGQIVQDGKPVEDIKVSDGEYILPKATVDAVGPEALDELRAATAGVKGTPS